LSGPAAKINSARWGNFKVSQLFTVLPYKKKFDANKITLLDHGYPYVVRMSGNNGQKGFIDEDPKYLNDGNTISFGQDTATMFYQEKPYFTGDKIKILKSTSDCFDKYNAQFIITALNRTFSSFGWGSSRFSVSVLNNQEVKLPITDNGQPDYAAMTGYIQAINNDRLSSLEQFLIQSGLDNTILTSEEGKALSAYENGGVKWSKFMLEDLFVIRNTTNIVSSEVTNFNGRIPYIGASRERNGVTAYISHDTSLLMEGNTLFIGGKTFTVFYQPDAYFSNDSHNIWLKLSANVSDTKHVYLFLATCVYNSLSSKYEWGNSISRAKIRNDAVTLPVCADGSPDYTFMAHYTAALEKRLAKKVAIWKSSRQIKSVNY
jgi:hypothetical protein